MRAIKIIFERRTVGRLSLHQAAIVLCARSNAVSCPVPHAPRRAAIRRAAIYFTVRTVDYWQFNIFTQKGPTCRPLAHVPTPLRSAPGSCLSLSILVPSVSQPFLPACARMMRLPNKLEIEFCADKVEEILTARPFRRCDAGTS